MTKFALPTAVAARLVQSTTPAPKPPQPAASEIVLISDWADYRAAHPELIFSGKFDLQGRAIFVEETK